jgi:hypothetical protein
MLKVHRDIASFAASPLGGEAPRSGGGVLQETPFFPSKKAHLRHFRTGLTEWGSWLRSRLKCSLLLRENGVFGSIPPPLRGASPRSREVAQLEPLSVSVDHREVI